MLKVAVSCSQNLLKHRALEGDVAQLLASLSGSSPRWETVRKAACSLAIWHLQVCLTCLLAGRCMKEGGPALRGRRNPSVNSGLLVRAAASG